MHALCLLDHTEWASMVHGLERAVRSNLGGRRRYLHLFLKHSLLAMQLAPCINDSWNSDSGGKFISETCDSLALSLKQSVSRCTCVAFSRCTERASMACARYLFTRFVGWWYTDEWRFFRGRLNFSVTLFCKHSYQSSKQLTWFLENNGLKEHLSSLDTQGWLRGHVYGNN